MPISPELVQSLPLQRYLEDLHQRLLPLREGEVASYIPELTQADPEWFGIALVTVDGNVYQVGDSRQGFTVQSISKAITYGLALEDQGIEQVFARVGVEPSGEAFNSISLEPGTGRPLNPMINAGAIATTGLIEGATREARLARILARFEKYVGHPVTVDEAVYASERDTGHRNRAISHLLRNYGILSGDPEDALDVYFKQCSIRVSARDLAVMGACLANDGVSPITGVVALQSRYVDKVLSVMSTCGMYDYSGNWVFSVGLPAKSGVGGGIMAVLPGQFGLGVFSPRLDAKGNSARGIAVCEALSREFALHTFKAARATSSSVLRVCYDATNVNSRRLRGPDERATLAAHGAGVRVYELQGQLMFGSIDSVLRTLAAELDGVSHVILDFRRVMEMDLATPRLLAALCETQAAAGRVLLFTGAAEKYQFLRQLARHLDEPRVAALVRFADIDRALEWCEDVLIERHRAGAAGPSGTPLVQQYLCRGLTDEELRTLCSACTARTFAAGETVFRAGDPADCFYFIIRGMVEILVRTEAQQERRLVALSDGMSFGEFALVTEDRRSAQARAVSDTECQEIRFCDIDEGIRNKLLANLARELARRLSREARELRILG